MGRLKVIVMLSILGLLGATNAWSVGYERVTVPLDNAHTKPVVKEASANGSFMQKCPALLDGTAAVIKDILSQFGLIEKKAQ